MPDWFSKDMEYWKPEQPPPTTPMRKPAGSGSWVAMISRTLLTALSVNRTGVAFGAGTASGVGVLVLVLTVLVAMNGNLLGNPCPFSVPQDGPRSPSTLDAFDVVGSQAWRWERRLCGLYRRMARRMRAMDSRMRSGGTPSGRAMPIFAAICWARRSARAWRRAMSMSMA